MKTVRRLTGIKKAMVLVIIGAGCLFQGGGCNLADMTVSPSITLSAEEMVTFLIRGLIFDPLENAVTSGIGALFDELGGDEE